MTSGWRSAGSSCSTSAAIGGSRWARTSAAICGCSCSISAAIVLASIQRSAIERAAAGRRGDPGEHVLGALGARAHAPSPRGCAARRRSRSWSAPGAVQEDVEHVLDLVLGDVGDVEHRAAEMLDLVRLETGRAFPRPRCRRAASAGWRRPRCRSVWPAAAAGQREPGACFSYPLRSIPGVGADQVAHDEGGAGGVLADEGADQGGARLIVARRLDHLQRHLDVVVGAGAVGERGGDLAADGAASGRCSVLRRGWRAPRAPFFMQRLAERRRSARPAMTRAVRLRATIDTQLASHQLGARAPRRGEGARR